MTRPKALDLYCGAGGAAKGLHDAGFDVIGVDKVFSKNYPYPMIVCDVLEVERFLDLGIFDFVWASAPCQRWSKATPASKRDSHPDLIQSTREILGRAEKLGACTAMENVPKAPLRADIILDGVHFGLPLERRRIFEVNFPTNNLQVGPRARPEAGQLTGPEIGPAPRMQDGPLFQVKDGTEFGGLPRAFSVAGGGGGDKGSMEEWSRAMGIDWMTRREIVQAVPPVYSEAIGR